MNYQSYLIKDIVAWWSNDDNSYDSISCDLYVGLAPDNTCTPYATFQIINDNVTPTTCGDLSISRLQFNIWGTDTQFSLINDIADEIRAKFDDFTVEDSDYYIECYQYRNSLFRKIEDNGWLIVIEYDVYWH